MATPGKDFKKMQVVREMLDDLHVSVESRNYEKANQIQQSSSLSNKVTHIVQFDGNQYSVVEEAASQASLMETGQAGTSGVASALKRKIYANSRTETDHDQIKLFKSHTDNDSQHIRGPEYAMPTVSVNYESMQQDTLSLPSTSAAVPCINSNSEDQACYSSIAGTSSNSKTFSHAGGLFNPQPTSANYGQPEIQTKPPATAEQDEVVKDDRIGSQTGFTEVKNGAAANYNSLFPAPGISTERSGNSSSNSGGSDDSPLFASGGNRGSLLNEVPANRKRLEQLRDNSNGGGSVGAGGGEPSSDKTSAPSSSSGSSSNDSGSSSSSSENSSCFSSPNHDVDRSEQNKDWSLSAAKNRL